MAKFLFIFLFLSPVLLAKDKIHEHGIKVSKMGKMTIVKFPNGSRFEGVFEVENKKRTIQFPKTFKARFFMDKRRDPPLESFTTFSKFFKGNDRNLEKTSIKNKIGTGIQIMRLKYLIKNENLIRGQNEGRGSLIYFDLPEMKRYEGEIKGEFPDGIGELFLHNGTSHLGEFKHGHRHGMLVELPIEKGKGPFVLAYKIGILKRRYDYSKEAVKCNVKDFGVVYTHIFKNCNWPKNKTFAISIDRLLFFKDMKFRVNEVRKGHVIKLRPLSDGIEGLLELDGFSRSAKMRFSKNGVPYYYKGKLKDFAPDGTGEMLNLNTGEVFDGKFKLGKRHGNIRSYTIDGKIASLVHYQNDVRHGKAYYYQKDGKTLEKEYKNGKVVSQKLHN